MQHTAVYLKLGERPTCFPAALVTAMEQHEGLALVSALDDDAPREGSPVVAAARGGEAPLEDVDMDLEIDADIFRPSAMLDARLDEEFGSARAFRGLWSNGAASPLVVLPIIVENESC